MNKLIPILVVVIIILGIIAFLEFGKFQQNTSLTKSTSIYALFPGRNHSFNIVANYSGNYADALVIVNSSTNATLMASPFLWNIGYALGNVNMTFNNYLHVAINLSQINKISLNVVDGYPGLMYGQELWWPFEYRTAQLKSLSLPMIVSQLPNFYSILNYSVYLINGSIDDFSYDIWLSQNPNVTSLQYGDFEVMIWMYWSENLSHVPYFIYVGNMTIPTLINGKIENLSWEVYVLPRTGSANGWTGVYFLSPLKEREVECGVPIAYILKNMGQFIENAGMNVYNPNTYYLDAIQVGMEFSDNHGTAIMGYYLYSWRIWLLS
ncbi:GH12 family glycosyl hydrolase domain-containing protein [Saccharolobus islandicus]|uniref:Cellulase (Endo 1,4 beta glucanase), putative (CelB) n=2 Tax=Saccharolobus islandicus TaxID=43080 RepID=M9UC91_SACIS|nr:cellulase [Sulfolobus islandicus]ADX81710.1 cellulase (endo 1,4 beta glucanase), putative (CelB) [Sulfolobus islandicus HVE10/4]AGJ61795.1 cellulase (endo 1,4 beta glucanase), putative (CelB) [Sulfolobus islandicus LAL14/1]WCM36925.1 cellulase [Sulfolobus islandicus]